MNSLMETEACANAAPHRSGRMHSTRVFRINLTVILVDETPLGLNYSFRHQVSKLRDSTWVMFYSFSSSALVDMQACLGGSLPSL